METAAFVSEAVLASCKFPKIPRSLRDDIVEESNFDAACSLVVDANVKLWSKEVQTS